MPGPPPKMQFVINTTKLKKIDITAAAAAAAALLALPPQPTDATTAAAAVKSIDISCKSHSCIQYFRSQFSLHPRLIIAPHPETSARVFPKTFPL